MSLSCDGGYHIMLDCSDICVRNADGVELTYLGGMVYRPEISAFELRGYVHSRSDGEPTLADLVKRSPLHVIVQGRRSFLIHFEATTWVPITFDQARQGPYSNAVHEQLVLRGARIEVVS
jgi:hypothetical protein